MKKLALAVVAFAAFVVVAAPDVDPWVKNYARFQHIVPQAFEQSLQANFIDAGTVKASAFVGSGTSINPSGKGTLVYDFPSIPATGAGSGCQDSAAGTATGCAFGDSITLGIDQIIPANNNAPPPIAWVSASGAFKVRICNTSNDGGAIDYPDASYTATCTR